MRKVFEEEKAGDKSVLYRSLEKEDAKKLHEYINTLSKEKTFITYQGHEVDFKEEKDYVESFLSDIKDKKAVKVIAEIDGQIVGVSDIKTKPRVEDHIGVFGVTVKKEARGKGIGKRLMEIAIEEAKESIPKLKIITLGVFANNTVAIKMYEKYGFKKYGNLLKGIQHKGKLVDHIEMYLEVRQQ